MVHSINPSVTVVAKAVDVQDEDHITELFGQIKSEHGKADVLINNAGCNKGVPIGTAPISDIWTDFVSLIIIIPGWRSRAILTNTRK
jgi:NADP-dependent 3-hydroxy acid dehydrogenase YdfG